MKQFKHYEHKMCSERRNEREKKQQQQHIIPRIENENTQNWRWQKTRWIAIVTSMNYCTTEKCNVTEAISLRKLYASPLDGPFFTWFGEFIVWVDSFKWHFLIPLESYLYPKQLIAATHQMLWMLDVMDFFLRIPFSLSLSLCGIQNEISHSELNEHTWRTTLPRNEMNANDNFTFRYYVRKSIF